MHKTMLSYIDRPSPVHGLTGTTKLVCFLCWSFAAMLTFDTRLIVFMLVMGILIFRISMIKLSDVLFVLLIITVFLSLNNLAIFLFSPYEGVKIYGSRTDIMHIAGNYSLTRQQLFYQFNVTLKYFTVLPVALLFLLTTQPSEFAASLNSVGVNYKIAYSVSLALRYIPDVQKNYHSVALAQQARGIDISRKEKLPRRITNSINIILPMIFTSMQRIETISNAMELRRFGKKSKRTWYAARPFRACDFIAMALMLALLGGSVWVTFSGGSRFYNPF